MLIQNANYYIHTTITTINFLRRTITNTKFSSSDFPGSVKPLLGFTNTKENIENVCDVLPPLSSTHLYAKSLVITLLCLRTLKSPFWVLLQKALREYATLLCHLSALFCLFTCSQFTTRYKKGGKFTAALIGEVL